MTGIAEFVRSVKSSLSKLGPADGKRGASCSVHLCLLEIQDVNSYRGGPLSATRRISNKLYAYSR